MAITFQIQIDRFRRSSSRPASRKSGKKFEKIKFKNNFIPDKATRLYFSELRKAITFEEKHKNKERKFFNFPFISICVDKFYYDDKILILTYKVLRFEDNVPVLSLMQKKTIRT